MSKPFGPFAVALALFVCSSALAATAYVDKMKAADGGPAWDSVKTLTIEGEITSSGLTGKFHRTEDLTNGRFVERAEYEPFSQADGLDSDGRWRQDPSRQIHALDSREAVTVATTEAYLVERGYFFPARVPAFIHPLPSAIESGKRFDLVEITPKDGRIVTLWVDQQTRLLDHAVYQLSATTRTIRFRDYRKVSGVTLPFEIATDDGDLKDAETVKIATYRIDAPDATAELKRPSNAITDARFTEGATEATAPLDLDAGRLLIEARINGEGPFPFLLDTGGHDILTPATAARLGLSPVGAGVSRGAGEGTTGIQFTKVETVAIGNAEMTDQPFIVLPLPYFVTERGKDTPIAGLIGLELFERFAVKLDYAAHRITLRPLDDFSSHGAGASLPIRFTDDMPLVAARFDDHPGLFGIDTGNAGDMVVFSPWAGPIGLATPFKAGIAQVSFGVGGPSTTYAARGHDLDLGGQIIKNAVARLAEDKAGAFAARSEAGNIGETILSRFTVTFDYRHETMTLEPLAAPDLQPFPRTGMGVSKTSPDGFLVNNVAKDGPAAEAGIASGDRIVSIDGVAATELGGADLYAKSRQPVGTSMILGMVHDGNQREVTLTLRELLP